VNWQRALIEIPARAVDLWFLWYRLLLTVTTIACVSVVVLMLILALCGIRVGW
jgi:hypothetical protein